MAVEITDQSFQETVLNSDKPVLVDFWAAWCGPCRMVGPVVDKINDNYEGRVKVAKINVDENPELAAKFNVRSIPAVFLMKNNTVVSQFTGVQSKIEIDKRIDHLISAEIDKAIN